MAEESFLLVSLEQQKSKKLAEVISNDTCRRILEALSKSVEGMTESEVSDDLNLPMSTVHYNLKNLVDAKLVLANEYHYSSRGKEVVHYKLANKLIIIAPQESDASKVGDILKRYLPVGGVVLGIGITIQLVQSALFSHASFAMAKTAGSGALAVAEDTAQNQAPQLLAAAAPTATQVAAGSAPAAMQQIVSAAPAAPAPVAPWFLIGAFCALIIIFLIEFVRARKKK
jgi:DNA-binding transcriptional ArsR family regulator